jgi:hypothetical protein
MDNKFLKEVIAIMKKFALISLSVQKIDRQRIQLVLTLIAIVMMVLGVGAPSDGTGPK